MFRFLLIKFAKQTHFLLQLKYFSIVERLKMKYITLKTLFTLVAIVIFTYQMYDAVTKFLDPTHVYVQIQMDLKEVEMPRIYICQLNQFNYTIANSFGYEYNTEYVIGHVINTNKISWSGNNSNVKDIQNKIYQFDRQRLPEVNRETSLIFIQPVGYCLEVTEKKSLISIKSTADTKVNVINPYIANDIRIEIGDPEADILEITPTYYETYEALKIQLNLDIFDDSIYRGKRCTNYKEIESTYGTYLYTEVTKTFMDSLGCLPQSIFQNNKEQCIKPLEKVSSMKKEKFETLAKKIYRSEPINLRKCRSPCKRMKISAKKIYHKKNYRKYGAIHLIFDDEVTVHTLVGIRGLFDLVTDLGSALGLWLGLSALNLFDGFNTILHTLYKHTCCTFTNNHNNMQ